MKINKGIMSLIFAFIGAAVLVSIGSVLYHDAATEVSYNLDDETDLWGNESMENGAEDVYILKEYKGNIAVYAENGEIREILSVAVVTLPLSERQKLKSGIIVNARELAAFIEDYTG